MAERSGPPRPRRDRRREATRETLRSEARRLFATRGYHQTTVDDIAAAADVSRRTFFRYFDSKAELLRAEVGELLPLVVAGLRERPASEPPLVAILAALRSVLSRAQPAELADVLGGPASGIRARIGLLRALGQWEEQIAAVLLERWPAGQSAPARTQLAERAAITAAAATSGLRSALQVSRGRVVDGAEPTTRQFLSALEEAYELLATGCPTPPGT